MRKHRLFVHRWKSTLRYMWADFQNIRITWWETQKRCMLLKMTSPAECGAHAIECTSSSGSTNPRSSDIIIHIRVRQGIRLELPASFPPPKDNWLLCSPRLQTTLLVTNTAFRWSCTWGLHRCAMCEQRGVDNKDLYRSENNVLSVLLRRKQLLCKSKEREWWSVVPAQYYVSSHHECLQRCCISVVDWWGALHKASWGIYFPVSIYTFANTLTHIAVPS